MLTVALLPLARLHLQHGVLPPALGALARARPALRGSLRHDARGRLPQEGLGRWRRRDPLPRRHVCNVVCPHARNSLHHGGPLGLSARPPAPLGRVQCVPLQHFASARPLASDDCHLARLQTRSSTRPPATSSRRSALLASPRRRRRRALLSLSTGAQTSYRREIRILPLLEQIERCIDSMPSFKMVLAPI